MLVFRKRAANGAVLERQGVAEPQAREAEDAGAAGDGEPRPRLLNEIFWSWCSL